MTRLIDLTLWKPISFGGEGSINYFSEPKHRIELNGAIIRIEGEGDVALLPFSDNVARSSPAPTERAVEVHPAGCMCPVCSRQPTDRPFLAAAAMLTPTIDQKMASQMKVKK